LALSVAVAVAGHALVGGAVALGVVPQLVALAGACWLLGEHLAGRRWLSVGVLAGVQLIVHFTLAGATPHPKQAPMVMHDHAHHMAMPMPVETPEPAMHEGLTGALTMPAAHLLALLAGVVLIDRMHRWAQRVLRILARLVPQLPAPVSPVPAVGRELPAVSANPYPVQWWLTGHVQRRGPPGVRVIPALP
jgi:drug/metabolite transporter (DMT)-like permease